MVVVVIAMEVVAMEVVVVEVEVVVLLEVLTYCAEQVSRVGTAQPDRLSACACACVCVVARPVFLTCVA